ncbi:hypothetical protein JG688_00006646 [Phytophthora aleatoria]|uniref:Uncharacterized protein n=1 Tax=Phytophthora aleatoria TaxID=2496075 RepID=A0A8J5IZC1_9STRA|nr:hypothetical protein JG688_00006646 [Phytophthora aleatoria]
MVRHIVNGIKDKLHVPMPSKSHAIELFQRGYEMLKLKPSKCKRRRGSARRSSSLFANSSYHAPHFLYMVLTNKMPSPSRSQMDLRFLQSIRSVRIIDGSCFYSPRVLSYSDDR